MISQTDVKLLIVMLNSGAVAICFFCIGFWFRGRVKVVVEEVE